MPSCKPNDVVSLARELIRIPSENRAEERDKGPETACARFVKAWLSDAGAVTEEQEVLPSRNNIIATLKGRGGKAPLIFVCHMDTVPAGQGWDEDPFGAILSGDRLYGRGAADMKGGLAASMMALKHIAEDKRELRGDLILCATVDEEGPDMMGATKFAQSGRVAADAMVVAVEPTKNKLCTAHRGVNWYRIDVRGKMSHAGNAHLGADANHALAWIIMELKQRAERLDFKHPLLGKVSITIGKMSGGFKTNVVPNSSTAEVDFRLVPPLTCAEADGFVRASCEAVSTVVNGTSAKAFPLGIQRPPIEVSEQAPVVEAFREAYENVTEEKLVIRGFPGYTDAGVIHIVTGNPQCVIFGPGDLAVAHSVNEYVSVEELLRAEAILTKAAIIALT